MENRSVSKPLLLEGASQRAGVPLNQGVQGSNP